MPIKKFSPFYYTQKTNSYRIITTNKNKMGFPIHLRKTEQQLFIYFFSSFLKYFLFIQKLFDFLFKSTKSELNSSGKTH